MLQDSNITQLVSVYTGSVVAEVMKVRLSLGTLLVILLLLKKLLLKVLKKLFLSV